VNVLEKCSHAQLPKFFNGVISPLASAALYISEFRLYDSSRSVFSVIRKFSDSLGAPSSWFADFGNKNEAKKNDPLR
jgi:hypothetical protein